MINLKRFHLIRLNTWPFIWSVTVSIVAAAILGGPTAQFTGAPEVTAVFIVGIGVLALCHVILGPSTQRLKND